MTFHSKETEHTAALLVSTSVNSCVRLAGWPACFVRLLNKPSREEQSGKASGCRANVSLIRGECDIYTHPLQHKKPERCCASLYFNNPLCHFLTPVMPKLTDFMKTHTKNMGSSRNSSAPCLCMTVTPQACMFYLYTYRIKTDSQSPLVTYNTHTKFTQMYIHTVHLQSAQRSPPTQHAINSTHVCTLSALSFGSLKLAAELGRQYSWKRLHVLSRQKRKWKILCGAVGGLTEYICTLNIKV